MINNQKASDRADGYWPQILEHAGCPPSVLNKQHQSCPFCGGTDRFRFADKGKGLWVCVKCTDSKYESGLSFLMNILGLKDYKEAAKWVHGYFDGSNAQGEGFQRILPPQSSETPEEIEARKRYRVQKMRDLIAQTRPVSGSDPVSLYLESRVPGLRGLTIPQGIRYHPNLEYWEAEQNQSKPVLRGRFPAMVVAGYDPLGKLVQVHKTYLTPDGRKAPVTNVKKTDVGVGSNSFALRMMEVQPTDSVLGVSEGIETGLASALMYDIPVWPCHSSSILSNFVLPEVLKAQIKRLVIFGDNDRPTPRRDGQLVNTGLAAARILADRCRAEKLRVTIVRPAAIGTDMCDLITD